MSQHQTDKARVDADILDAGWFVALLLTIVAGCVAVAVIGMAHLAGVI